MRALILLLCALVASTGASSCFSRTYGPCHTLSNDTTHLQVTVIPEADAQLYQNIVALVCYHQQANSSYCWDVRPVTTCDNCSSVLLSVSIGGHVLSLERLTDLLNREDTKLALLLAGYTLHPDMVQVGSVPVASWVCLAVGLLLSSLVLSKPLWWDRLVIKGRLVLTTGNDQTAQI